MAYLCSADSEYAARAEPMFGEDRPTRSVAAGNAVPVRPRLLAAHEPLAHRSLEAVVQLEDVVRAAARAVVGRVDAAARRVARSCSRASIASRRSAGAGHASVACEVRAAACCNSSGARHAAGHRPPDVERVQRRDARAAFADLDGGKRDVQPRLRGADRQPQLQLLELRALGLRREGRAERRARRRAAADPPAASAGNIRSASAGHEDDVERAAAHLRGAGDEHASVAPRRRLRFDAGEPIGSTRAASSSVTGPMAPIGRKSARTRSTRSAGAAREGRAPRSGRAIPPRRRDRPRRHHPHDRQRERGQLTHVVDLPREMIDAGRPGLGPRKLSPLKLGLVDQAVQTARPALAAR